MLYDKPKIFFTADLHIGHRNIIKYSNRPFANEDEMNEALITNWNKTVGNTDNIYVLGDFSFAGPRIEAIFKRLNGNKFLIKGNHDDKHCTRLPWVWVKETYELRIDDDSIWLSHYPHRSWNKSFHGAYHFYGHTHGHLPDFGRSTDVGVDCWKYTPVSLEELKEKLKNVVLPKHGGTEAI
jgi:calcineurin-like phosphoesterase family protein